MLQKETEALFCPGFHVSVFILEIVQFGPHLSPLRFHLMELIIESVPNQALDQRMGLDILNYRTFSIHQQGADPADCCLYFVEFLRVSFGQHRFQTFDLAVLLLHHFCEFSLFSDLL